MLKKVQLARSRKPAVAAVLGALPLLILTACGSSSSSAGGATTSGGPASASAACPNGSFNVLAVLPLSGNYQRNAVQGQRGAEAAATVINRTGGILGCKVKITVKNDQLDDSLAASDVSQAVQGSSKPDFIVLGVSGDEALAGGPIAMRAKIPVSVMAVDAVFNNTKRFPYMFSGGSPASAYLGFAVKAMKQRGVHRVAAVVGTDEFGQGENDYLKSALPAAGISYKEVAYDPTALDMTSSFRQALAFHPDMIYIEGGGDGVPRLLQSRVAANAVSVPVMFGPGFSAYPPAPLVGNPGLKNSEILTYSFQDQVPGRAVKPAQTTFLDALIKQGAIQDGLQTFAFAYDPLMLFRDAATIAKSTNPDKVFSVLRSHNLSTSGAVIPDNFKLGPSANFNTLITNSEYTLLTGVTGSKNGLFIGPAAP